MKNFQYVVVILLFMFGFQTVMTQDAAEITKEVVNRLEKLKPPNEKNYVYKVAVPSKPVKLPENIRLDIVYKIGHYEFQYVALRLEKTKGQDFVNVTRFIYGSALGFYKPYSKGEIYSAAEGKIISQDFDYLLNLAYFFYQSHITKEYIAPRPIRRTGKGGRSAGIGSGVGSGGSSWTGSSGDGRISISLVNFQNGNTPIITENGTLHDTDLKNRISNGYEDLRVHLFWEVFNVYFEKHNVFADLDKVRAEEIAIARLEEPPFNASYTDYFRQSLFVEILGEIGTAQALPILEKLAASNSLEKDWDQYLSEDAKSAIKKINSRAELRTE